MLEQRAFTTTASRWAKGRGAHQGKGLVFRNVFFVVSLPVILALTGRAVMKAHSEEPKERVPFVKYEFLRRRTKRFPWGEGVKSLFHNPHTNALPDGYEDEIEQEEQGKHSE